MKITREKDIWIKQLKARAAELEQKVAELRESEIELRGLRGYIAALDGEPVRTPEAKPSTRVCVIESLRKNGPMTVSELLADLKLHGIDVRLPSLRSVLSRLGKDGTLRRVGMGKWELKK